MQLPTMLRYCTLVWVYIAFATSCRETNPVLVVYMYAHPQIVRQLGPLPEPEHNRFRPQIIALGRRLFYETKLSANDKVSCASCHLQHLGFSDGISLSKSGVSGEALFRNSPPLINLAWSKNGLFWDGGAKNLESQILGPLHNEDEMAQAIGVSVEKLRKHKSYRQDFAQAFADRKINNTNILHAISQFVRTLVSFESHFDKAMRKDPGVELNSNQQKGYVIYQSNCSTCHVGLLFTDNFFHNNGLDSIFPSDHEGQRTGHFRISRKLEDMGKFKTPTLRNIAVTGPYMHDGRFASLDDVIEHYSSGIKHSATLDAKLPTGGFQFSAEEKKQLKEFLLSLSDEEFLKRREFRLD